MRSYIDNITDYVKDSVLKERCEGKKLTPLVTLALISGSDLALHEKVAAYRQLEKKYPDSVVPGEENLTIHSCVNHIIDSVNAVEDEFWKQSPDYVYVAQLSWPGGLKEYRICSDAYQAFADLDGIAEEFGVVSTERGGYDVFGYDDPDAYVSDETAKGRVIRQKIDSPERIECDCIFCDSSLINDRVSGYRVYTGDIDEEVKKWLDFPETLKQII